MVPNNDIAQMRYILNLRLPTEARMLMEHVERLVQRGPVERQMPPVQVDNFDDMMRGGDGWMNANHYFSGPAPGQSKPGLLTDDRMEHVKPEFEDPDDLAMMRRMTGLLMED